MRRKKAGVFSQKKKGITEGCVVCQGQKVLYYQIQKSQKKFVVDGFEPVTS